MRLNFGNKKPTIIQYAIIGVVLTSLIGGISKCSGISQNTLWDLFDELQRKHQLNEFTIKDPEKLNRRIHRDVDKAIENITPEYDRIIRESWNYGPRYSDGINDSNDSSVCYSDDCKTLSPPMRLCASWVSDCFSETP